MTAGKRRWIGIRAAKALTRFIVDESYRSEALVRIASPRRMFQPYNFTLPDRYPELFRLAGRLVGDGYDRRILSFGCSTGEEVFALRKYFPKARIEGVDINPRNIAISRRRLARNLDRGIEFKVSNSLAGCDSETYDAVFCMAVFRHGALSDGLKDRCDAFIQFRYFDSAMADIARCVKVGGLLFVEHSNFRFADTDAFSDFDSIDEARRRAAATDSPIYDRHDQLVPAVEFRDIAFKKIAGDA